MTTNTSSTKRYSENYIVVDNSATYYGNQNNDAIHSASTPQQHRAESVTGTDS
jgi:hypothetical protein